MSGNGRNRAVLCLALTILTLLSACGTDRTTGEAMLLEPGSVSAVGEHSVAPVVRGDMYRAVYVPAVATYYRPEAVICGDLAGATLLRILVKRDQMVQAGDVIAEFDVEYSQAELSGLYADLEIASLQYETNRQTYQAALDAAKAALAGAPASGTERTLLELAVKRAQNEYDEYVRSGSLSLAAMYDRIAEVEARIENTTVTAPCSGIVSSVKHVEEGTVVTADTVLCEIADPESRFFQVESRVDSTRKLDHSFHWGGQVFITNALCMDGAEIPGHVVFAPDAGGGGGTALVTADDPEMMQMLLTSGVASFVTARYTLSNVLMIPNTALQREGSDVFVDVLADGVICKRYVLVGVAGRETETDAEVLQVLEGLSEGDLVMIG